MKAIIIDPQTMTVEETDFVGDYRDIQNTVQCRCFTIVNIDGPTNDALFVDDEGLLKGSGHVFKYMGYPLVGRGLILGTDDEGESIGTGLTVPDVSANVEWVGECTFNL